MIDHRKHDPLQGLRAGQESQGQADLKPTTHSPAAMFAGTFTSSSTTKACISAVWSRKISGSLPTFAGVPGYFSGQFFRGHAASSG